MPVPWQIHMKNLEYSRHVTIPRHIYSPNDQFPSSAKTREIQARELGRTQLSCERKQLLNMVRYAFGKKLGMCFVLK